MEDEHQTETNPSRVRTLTYIHSPTPGGKTCRPPVMLLSSRVMLPKSEWLPIVSESGSLWGALLPSRSNTKLASAQVNRREEELGRNALDDPRLGRTLEPRSFPVQTCERALRQLEVGLKVLEQG